MVGQEENLRKSGGGSRAVRASIEATLTLLRAELAKTQRLVQQQVEQSAELHRQQQLLCSIPMISRIRLRVCVIAYNCDKRSCRRPCS
jgi:hypothetical protein